MREQVRQNPHHEYPSKELSKTVLQNCFLGFDCPTIVLQLYYC
jgi:hypothetical protein